MAAVYQDIHREIIELSKAGNQKAQYQLYKLYSKAMLNICWRMLNNREEAEDLLQESFTDAFMKLDSFRPTSKYAKHNLEQSVKLFNMVMKAGG